MNVFIYTKSQALCNKQDNFRSVFIYKKQDTLHCAILRGNFEVGIYIQNSWHFALRDVFIYKNPEISQEARQFALRSYIQKSGHFTLRNFSLIFLNWRRGGGIFALKKQCTLRHIFMCRKQSALRYVFTYKKPDTLLYIFIHKKQCTLRYIFISNFFRIVLIPYYKRT